MKSIDLSTLGAKEFNDFLRSFDTVLTDCDGVLWIRDSLIPGSENALNGLRKMGKSVFYVTNSSTKTRDEFVEKCRKMGFKATQNEIISASYLTACYLKDNNFKKKTYVFGSTGITKELDNVEIDHNDVGPDPMDSDTIDQIKLDPDVGAVIVGFDEHLSLPKIVKACSYLKNPECLFVATNIDQQAPFKRDIAAPAAGCMVAAIEYSTGRKPILIGKPGPYIRDFLIKRLNINPHKTLFIGDRGNTDILLGTRSGFKTLMVLSGISSLNDIEKWEKSDDEDVLGCVPNYFTNSLADIVPKLCTCNK